MGWENSVVIRGEVSAVGGGGEEVGEGGCCC